MLVLAARYSNPGFCYCFDALADRSRKIHFDTLRRDSLLLRQGGGVFLVENDNHTWLLWGWWSKCWGHPKKRRRMGTAGLIGRYVMTYGEATKLMMKRKC
jgi:hypothetical protein